MQQTTCIRCGKVRIFSRRWKEKVDGKGTMITHEESVCPDPECQKIVDQQFLEMRDRRARLGNGRQGNKSKGSSKSA